MATLNIHQGQRQIRVDFEPPVPLSRLLAANDVQFVQPCGGRGTCGKCAVMLNGQVSAPSAAEIRCGNRLSCQAVLLGDADVILPDLLPMAQIEGGSFVRLKPVHPMDGKYGAAVDIGTTTIALQLYDLVSGQCLGSAGMRNPQTSVAADVIGRIGAAMQGQSASLQQQVQSAVSTLLTAACAQAGVAHEAVVSMVVSGNTTMLYLLTGQDPTSLSRAPFHADCLFGTQARVIGRTAYLPNCLHAFVGADTTCALLASGLLESTETALLCDIGTNGEMALWHHGTLYIASTAAGPAFEGAGISCGCASIPGAIDRIDLVNGRMFCHTIGQQKAVGLCGSGLLDAMAALLDTEIMDETGCLEEESVELADGVALTQADIRAVQLAKAATYAGIISLLDAAKCDLQDVQTLYLAGGFGNHMNIRSAVRIGLIPAEIADRVRMIGNAALDGAALLLMDTQQRTGLSDLRNKAVHVRLDGNPEFAERYVEAILFES